MGFALAASADEADIIVGNGALSEDEQQSLPKVSRMLVMALSPFPRLGMRVETPLLS